MLTETPNIVHETWEEFSRDFRYDQGEHVIVIGPTGCGKTTILLEIMEQRRFVCVFATKPFDPTLEKLRDRGFTVIREWPPPVNVERVVLWPKIQRITDQPNQQKVFAVALADIYHQGKWCAVVDEMKYVSKNLRLGPILEMLLQQGRSLKCSFLGAVQRPAWIPLAAYSEPSHVFVFKPRDIHNVRRVGEIAGDPDALAAAVKGMGRHEVAYASPFEDRIIVTQVDRRIAA